MHVPADAHSLYIHSSSPSAAYMHHWTESASVQVMACRLFGDKPLPEPMLAYFQLHFCKQISVKLEPEFYHFHSRKCISNCHLPKWRPFCPSRDELMDQASQLEQHIFDYTLHKVGQTSKVSFTIHNFYRHFVDNMTEFSVAGWSDLNMIW